MNERLPGWVDGMDASDARLATGALVMPATGTGSDLPAIQATPGIRPATGAPGAVSPGDGLAVTVNPFQAVIQDGTSSAGGAYLLTLDGAIQVALEQSDQTSGRTDLVIAELVTDPENANAGRFAVRALTGPYDTGAPPTPPESAIVLAEVAVPANAATVDPGGVVDLRAWTCALGGVLPIANAGARPRNPYSGLYVHNLAAGVLEMYDGEGWRRFSPDVDTGWIDLPPIGPTWAPRPEQTGPQIRRVGKVVFLRGYVYAALQPTGDTRAILTLPEEFRPADRYEYIVPASGADKSFQLMARASLTHWDIGQIEVGPGGWFSLAASWPLG